MDARLWPCRWAALVAHPHSATSSPRTCGPEQASPWLSAAATWPLRSSWCTCAFCSSISSSRPGGREFSRPAPEPPCSCPDPRAFSPTPASRGRAGEGGVQQGRPENVPGRVGYKVGRSRSLTFLHAARPWGRRWDGPQEGLWNGHPGLGGGGDSVRLGGEGMGTPSLPTPLSRFPNLAGASPLRVPMASLSSLFLSGWGRSPHPPPLLQGSDPPGTAPQVSPPLHPAPKAFQVKAGSGPRLSLHRRGCSLCWVMTPAPSSPRGHGQLQRIRVTLTTLGDAKVSSYACAGPASVPVPGAFALCRRLLLFSLHL